MALAPEQTGIGIRRHFTTPGGHPYDELTWERRDARITNFRDGSVAFEQLGVEFPVGWSLNATNIVAQKYFRGTPGTVERESSLRQVIDRVADTIAAWGTEGGYFVDATEVEAFRDELKHLLVTQKAAFNSPVWFNIGVPGVPAQASACFILSVDDEMDSILNWYVEEGTIFKGGSGSGINLSRIRSSRELLKGGGTASGPVSFMRGADASAGTIKCLHADTPIVTSDGVVPIRSAQPGARVLTRFGWKPIEGVHDNGARPLVRLRTGLGDEITCTPEHRFRVRGREGEVWREAGELRPDDHVVVDLDTPRHGVKQPLVGVQPGHHREAVHQLPTVLDEGFAMWLGLVYGDGSVTSRPSAKFVALQVGDTDAGMADRYQALTRSVFGPDVHFSVDRHADKPDASASVRFSSGQIIGFLEANGLRKGGACDLRVPALVQAPPGPVRAAFLAGLFEADGHLGNGYPWLSTVSEALAHDVHRLLLSIGIPSKIGCIDDRRTAHGTRPVHTVRIVGGEGVRRFAKQVGFVSDRKHHLLEACVVRKDASRCETQWFLPHVAAELSAIWQGTADQRLRRVLAPYCRYQAPRAMSLLRARALLDRFPTELGASSLASFALGEVFYEPVSVEPAGVGPTFDLTVADVHEYLVHSRVTHNSGGKTRRAAKMVILDVDHPDIEEFIWVKAREEQKIRVLSEAGFDMSLDGRDMASVQYQNANNSVRVTDEFMQAVVDDADWHLRAVTTGEIVKTVRARDLMRQISEATWACADPGMQFDTTINRWHTAATTGRINASNPCFPGDALVHTDKGLVSFVDLLDRARLGETFGVYTHDATRPDVPSERMELTTPDAVMVTGTNEIVKLRFDNGMELRCTPGHRIFTINRGYVEAQHLTAADRVKTLDLLAPAVSADRQLPVSCDVRDYAEKGDWSRALAIPEKWSDDLAHYLGWMVGDGCLSGDTAVTVYGAADDIRSALPRHEVLVAEINGGRPPKPSVQADGTVQLRQTRRVTARFLEALGLTHAKAAEKTVPWSVNEAPTKAVAAFLQGLFDADGCVYDGAKSRYVGLGSSSAELLRGVQRLLTTFGISCRTYATKAEGEAAFTHVRKDGTVARYGAKPKFDLRISGSDIAAFAQHIGFSLPAKASKLEALLDDHRFYTKDRAARLVERTDDGVELTYNLSEPRNHSYVVNGIVVRNCSEYMHLDNSACNLASINLLKFLPEGADVTADSDFDVAGFIAAVEVMFTAQEILVGRADYPTESIAETTRRFRQLGLGYANLGAMLMALGLPYDSDAGRAWAGAITALMTGHAYATSARTAARMGPFAGYAENAEHMQRVLEMHREAAASVDEELVPSDLLGAAQQAWDEACELGAAHGVRNSQASVLAPTGCLVGGSLVATGRGLVRLGSLGDPDGPQCQDLDLAVATDEGVRQASKFYVNGLEQVVDVTTARGYRIQGTTKHRIKVVDGSGEWQWRRFADLRAGDRVPLSLEQLVGESQSVALPPIGEGYRWAGEHWADERHVTAPRRMMAELAELIGYFMGDGSLHAKGLRLCVAESDLDVIDHLERLGKSLFGIAARTTPKQGYAEVAFHSVRLAEWWDACGFAKRRPHEAHAGKGWTPHIPDAVLHSNDREVYRSFLRGLFEADGTVTSGYPSWTTTSSGFSHDVQSLMLALGFVTTRSFATSGRGLELAVLRLLNQASNARWLDEIGFLSGRKAVKVHVGDHPQAARYDHILVSRELLDRVAPGNDRLRKVALAELRRGGGISRRLAVELHDRSADAQLGHLLGFFYDTVASAELGDEEFTYDLSVPDNVTYLANGFISHNTIGLMMDCDTTGVEPDLGLCKMKKLVGGGTMTIVNQTIPRALRRLGYSVEQIDEVVAYIDENKTIIGAPHVSLDHVDVFACSMGDNAIHYNGHIRMLGAVQPFLSGAVSKTVNMPEDVSVEDVEQLHIDAWRLGVKAVAIYRDNCKVGQPLAMAKKGEKAGQAPAEAVAREIERVVETIVVKEPVRKKLPRTRTSKTFSFRVADCHGYVTVGEYDDGRPGELFLRVSKQGSTLAGIMDAFAISVSHGLQYGVPLRAFVEMYTNMRFEPAGMTDDPDIRFASSLVDYIFRRLAVDYLTYEERAEVGILTVGERTQPTLPGVEESATRDELGHDVVADPPSIPSASTLVDTAPTPPSASSPVELAANARVSDAPYCMQCGIQMLRAGSCHACPSCGSTSGCS